MDAKLFDIVRANPTYPYEAYEFVCDAVTYTQEQLGRLPFEDDDPDADHHVSGPELCRGAVDLAVRLFGMMAPVVFRQWNVRGTDDIGAIVFYLIEHDHLSRSDRDHPADFHDLFDVDQALAAGFAFDSVGGGDE